MRSLEALKVLATDDETHVNNHMKMMISHATAYGLLAVPGLASTAGNARSAYGLSITISTAFPFVHPGAATTDVLVPQAENTINMNTSPCLHLALGHVPCLQLY